MISFIIPFSSIDEHRVVALSHVHRKLQDDWSAGGTAEFIVCSASTPDGGFHRSAARNRGADLAQGDIFVFVDADSVVVFDQVALAVNAADHYGWAFPYDLYYSLTKESSAALMGGDWTNLDFEYVFPGPDPVDRPPAVGGIVVVHREVFEQVGGYDERFIGWGFEDRAFALALRALLGPAVRIPGPLYHLWHPAPAEETNGQPHFEKNREIYNSYLELYGPLVG